jgi:MFS family permease
MWWVFVDDYPREARWISPEEREFLETTLGREGREVQSSGFGSAAEIPWRELLNPAVLVMVGVYLLQNIGNYGYLFWLPSALQNIQKMSNSRVGLLAAIPYLITAVGMVLVSRHSDKKHERRLHVAFGLAWGGALMLVCILLTAHFPAWSFLAISLVGAGSYSMLGPFWAIPTETLPRSLSGPAIGMVNALGNLGGYFGPLAVGYVYHRTGDFRYAFAVLSLAMILGAVTALFLPQRPVVRTTSDELRG